MSVIKKNEKKIEEENFGDSRMIEKEKEEKNITQNNPARARRACVLRALGLLLADGAPTVGRGKTF